MSVVRRISDTMGNGGNASLLVKRWVEAFQTLVTELSILTSVASGDLLFAEDAVSLVCLISFEPEEPRLTRFAHIPSICIYVHFSVRRLSFSGLVINIGSTAHNLQLAFETVTCRHEVFTLAAHTDRLVLGIKGAGGAEGVNSGAVKALFVLSKS